MYIVLCQLLTYLAGTVNGEQMRHRPRAKSELRPDVVVTWTDSQNDQWNVIFEFKVNRNVARVSGFSINAVDHAAPLTAQTLRELPFGELSSKTQILLLQHLPRAQSESLPVSAGGRHSSSRLELRRVAALYLEARKTKRDTQRVVAEALGVSRPTAARRIRAARNAGLLDIPKQHKKAKVKK